MSKYAQYLRKTYTKQAMHKRQELRLSGHLNAPLRKRAAKVRI